MRTIRFYGALACALTLGIAVVHVLGATSHPEWWGVHFYRFLNPAALWVAVALLALGVLIAFAWPAWLERAISRGSAARSPWLTGALLALGSLISFWIFWTFREAHTLLGDGHPLTQNLPRGQWFHPDEPLSLYLHHVFYQWARGWFEHPGVSATEVARDTVGLSSAIAGALFVPIVWCLARQLGATGLVFAVLVTQGFIQLFFGYVENYTFYCLTIAAFAWASLRVFAGRAPLALPGVLVIVASALHLAGGLLVPAFGVLLLHELSQRERRAAAARDLLICAGVFLAMDLALSGLHPHYSWFGMLANLAGSVTRSGSSYGFKRPGASDFLNQQMLIGPLGLFLFLPVAVVAMVGGALRTWRGAYLLAIGAAFLLASMIAGDSNLGVARNWDLLAPAGFAFTFAAVGLALQAAWTARDLHRWLFLLAAASLFHTVPWVANNASFERAFARFQTLRLGLGRTQAVVGNVYLERGQVDSAAVWFRRALDENPANNLAAYELGRIAMSRGDYAFACNAFIAALQARPGTQQYQYMLVGALVRSGRLDYARREMDRLLGQNEGEPLYWAASSVVWQCLGQPDSSAASIARAERLSPGDSLLSDVHAALARRDGYSAALESVWPRVTLP